MHLQIALSVVAILGAAGVALLCDFLRNKNEQLRQAMVEMQTQRQPEGYPAVAAPGAGAAGPGAAPAHITVPSAPDRAIARIAAPEASFDQGVDLTPRRGRRRLAPSADASNADSDSGASEELIRRAAARAGRIAAGENSARMVDPATMPVMEQTGGSTTRGSIGDRPAGAKLTLVGAPAAEEPENAIGREPMRVIVDERVWRSLVANKPLAEQPPARAEMIPPPEAAAASPAPDKLSVPAGMHTGAALAKLLESEKPFSGLALAVSVNETGPHFSPASEPVMRAASERLQELLRPQDFACRSGAKNEFILICPGVAGVDAQRHLSHFSERLWDFQLRSLENCSILFSLGSAEVQREALTDAVALARERMRQTQRGRKTVALPGMRQQRKAV